MTYGKVKQSKTCKRMSARLKQCLAVVLALALTFSGMPIGGNFTLGGVESKADVSFSESEAVTGSGISLMSTRASLTETDYELDVTEAGNNVTDTNYWTLASGYYKLDSTLSTEEYVQDNGVFGLYPTGSKVKIKQSANAGIQLDGSVNSSGQAGISIDLSSAAAEDTYDLEIVYTAKGSSAATIKYGAWNGSQYSLTTTDSSSSSTSDQVTYTTSLEGGSKYLIGAASGMIVKNLKISLVEEIELSGTVSCAAGTSLPDSASYVVYTYGTEEYKGEVQADGSYTVTLPASSIEKEYEISFSDGAYVISPEVEAFAVTRSVTDGVDITVQKVSSYILSGSYTTGLDAEDVAKITGLVFTAETESSYEVPETEIDTANGTYSVRLEIGTTYSVKAEGVNDYEIVSPTSITESANATVNIEFAKKDTYAVTLNLGSGPDLSNMNVTYNFTHEDGSEYSFTDASAISLRDGEYTVSLGGDFAQVAYKVAASSTSLTVDGAAVRHAISFEEVTSWSFVAGPGDYYNQAIQGGTGYYQGLYIDATSGKVAPNGATPNSAQFTTGAVIYVPVTGTCTLTVTAYQGQYALYNIVDTPADTSAASTTYEYTGSAGTIAITSTGSAYIAGISVAYPAEEVEYVEQDAMPYVPGDDADANTAYDTDGIPRGSVSSSITVQPVGQKLTVAHSGGNFNQTFSSIENVGYYLFPKASTGNKLEFDVEVTKSLGSSNEHGFFGGVFTDNYVYSLGLRKGGTNVRGIYSKNGGLDGGNYAGAGSPDASVALNTTLHYVIEFKSGKPAVTVTGVDANGEAQEWSWSQGALAENGSAPTEFYYGFAVTSVEATVTNMIYTDADGTVLYDQNACYYPEGSAPVATAVTAVGAESREYIDISWEGSVAEDDGTYVVEMQKDGGDWVELTSTETGFSYQYVLPEGEGGSYLFRVCGQLGKETLGGSRNSYVTMTTPVYVVGALAKPEVTATAAASSVALDWQDVEQAEYYLVYRYSYDEGAEGATQIAKVTASDYTDTAVTAEVPYYYYVKAVSDTASNESPFSETVWVVPTAGHTSEYVYEDEATEITLTKKSYDTVFNGEISLAGVVSEAGTMTMWINDEEVTAQSMSAGDSFSFTEDVDEGRNDVELIFTDESGNKTRKAYNFVYLTNYDMVVDASYAGTDGEEVNGIPTYSTVQAAVDAASGTEQTVILVMAGSYEERLEVTKANVSLIGEDRESTSIHYFPGEKDDMKKRCATYVYESAEGFSAENITFANDCVYADYPYQQDAIRCEAEGATFVNVKLIGVQDTLYMHSGHQYFYKCRIEGLIDFIYSGDAARAFFNDCEIVFVYESTKKSGYVAAPKTAEDATYGLTFYNCVLTSEEGCNGTGYLLARPWGADAYITWINCYMGGAINADAPYSSMSGAMPEDARFFEYGTYGPGFAINTARRQISPNKAAEMITDSYLGWSPESVSATVADGYVGNIVTDREPQYVESEVTESHVYLWTDGDDTGLKAYDAEGYAEAYGVSGGGLLKETNENYYKVATAEEFLNALITAKTNGKDSVIELTADINLGCNEIENFASYSSIIKAYSSQALTHPTLIESGVSTLAFDGIYNMTIFSQNGASIKHANITMKRSENIIIRNIKFDELWEWDEATGGDYDRNDWDYMTIDTTCDGIWIDHCTFYKAYDGIVDIKNPNPETNVTISWCEFLPGSEGNTFFNEMMDEITANPQNYPTYQHMLDEGMTARQIYMYAYGQKKTHLFGQSDDATSAAGINATLANNYYKDSMDRMPRLRYGSSHVYNCVMDAQDLLDVKNSITNTTIASKIVSNGAASTCGGQVLLENCYISGIINALNSGNGSSPSGYINAVNSIYYMNGELTDLAPKANSSADDRVLVTDADAFVSGLPYSGYVLYDADELEGIVVPNAGAGKLNLTVLQWEKVSYNAELTVPGGSTSEPDDSDDDDDDDYGSSSSSSSSRGPGSTTTVKPSNATAVDEGSKGTWQKDDKGWWFSYTADGSYAKDSWHMINGHWYSFDAEGYIKTGWQYDNGYQAWFYLAPTGEMQTGWVYDASYGTWFHMAESGVMQTGWLFDKGYNGWFYLNTDGTMRTGWLQDVTGIWYYLKPNGVMAVNETTPDGYHVGANGAWIQ